MKWWQGVLIGLGVVALISSVAVAWKYLLLIVLVVAAIVIGVLVYYRNKNAAIVPGTPDHDDHTATPAAASHGHGKSSHGKWNVPLVIGCVAVFLVVFQYWGESTIVELKTAYWHERHLEDLDAAANRPLLIHSCGMLNTLPCVCQGPGITMRILQSHESAVYDAGGDVTFFHGLSPDTIRICRIDKSECKNKSVVGEPGMDPRGQYAVVENTSDRVQVVSCNQN